MLSIWTARREIATEALTAANFGHAQDHYGKRDVDALALTGGAGPDDKTLAIQDFDHEDVVLEKRGKVGLSYEAVRLGAQAWHFIDEASKEFSCSSSGSASNKLGLLNEALKLLAQSSSIQKSILPSSSAHASGALPLPPENQMIMTTAKALGRPRAEAVMETRLRRWQS